MMFFMVLVTHAVVGAAVASFVPTHPVEGFVLGFLSNFMLDAIPHWDYKIRSGFVDPNRNTGFIFSKDVVIDAFKICTDLFLGCVLVYILFSRLNSSVVLYSGVVGAILPDILQFVQAKIPWKPIVELRRFHVWIQSDKRFSNRPVIGILMQCAIIVIVSAAVLLSYSF